MLSIQTNVNSLVAQENLNINNAFQSKTIQQLTSGYRINSSGDDAAGLAVANQYRNSVSELTQGVANGNDGVAQLQIMDGGISNISQILDRLKTLASQSSSGTFTGDRTVLNNEFQTDINELDRQAQSIGLNTGGNFAKSLGVYLGGGAGSTSASALANGVVTVDLSKSTVDSQSLGLTGMQSGNTGYDLSTSNILAIKTNGGNTTFSPGSTQFIINGPGFGSGVAINVATSAITDGASLVAAINQAMTSAGVSDPAFAAAGITASMTTDATTQHQVLSFSSGGSAFQVKAGDLMANAFLGNVTGSTGGGTTLAATLTGNAYNGNFATADSLNITVGGAGLAVPINLTPITANVGGGSAASTAVLIQNAVTANAALAAAGITVTNTSGHLDFISASGQALNVSITGDSQNVLGYGSFIGTGPATSFTAGGSETAPANDGVVTLDLSLDGSTSASLSVSIASATDTNAAAGAAKINAAIAALGVGSAFAKAGIIARDNGSGQLQLVSSNNTLFRLGVRNDGTTQEALGFYNDANRSTVLAYTAPTTPTALFKNQDAQGEYQLGTMNAAGVGTAAPLTFSALSYATDKQTLTVSAADSSGASHSVVVTLNQANAQNIDQAIANINGQIQASGDSTLMQINAVKVNVGGTEKIEFASNVANFSVNIGGTTNGTGITPPAGGTATSVKVGTGGAADISTEAGAQDAITAITSAVSLLGVAQAAVGKGENQLNYAVNLAQSQITNLSSAESQIRDADVAQQAANLTKAQVLQQASIAAMAQANSAPQAVLSLLKQ